MCLIIYNQFGKPIPREWIKNAYEMNSDGFGIMWAEKGSVHTIKGMFEFDQISSLLKDFKGRSYACHFRYKTHGVVNAEQCHPHRIIKNKLYMMHNGILDGFPENSVKSDTMLFAHYLKKKIKFGKITLDTFFNFLGIRQLEKKIGRGNKLLFMNDRGYVSLVNEKQGTWDQGVWYSNLYSLGRRWAKEPSPILVDEKEHVMTWLEETYEHIREHR